MRLIIYDRSPTGVCTISLGRAEALLCLTQTVTFLPTEFSNLQPIEFFTGQRSFSLYVELCQLPLYTGCSMTATINLPFTAFDAPSGTAIQFSVYGSADSCSAPLCSNNVNNKTNPFSCTFVYKPAFGEKLYIIGVGGNAASYTATFNFRTTCGSSKEPETPRIQPINTKTRLEACPTTAKRTKRYIALRSAGAVPTSYQIKDAKKYSLVVCPDQSTYVSLNYNVQATDQYSAFASYFCLTTPCTVNNSPPAFFDDSGTALNKVSISNLQNQMIYFTLFGWGKYEGSNSYLFNIDFQGLS